MWGLVICGAFAILVALLAAVAGSALFALAFLPGAGFLIFGIWSIVLLVQYNRKLKHIAQLATDPNLVLAPVVDLRSIPSPAPVRSDLTVIALLDVE